MSENCEHIDQYPKQEFEPATECPDCIKEGTTWVALRRCLDCGNVGCCDSSPGLHATAHHKSTEHPVMQSAMPGQDWRWCYVHEAMS